MLASWLWAESQHTRRHDNIGGYMKKASPEQASPEAASADLRAAWNRVARGYLAYWAPRFRPWMEVAVAAMPSDLEGTIVVPCCGPGVELDLLAARFDKRRLSGIDFSEAMVEVCRERGHAADLGDAMALPGGSSILSTFGLQQLPEPAVALQQWVSGLPAGGALSVMFWPYNTADEGPFDMLREWGEAELGGGSRPWEAELLHGLPPDVTVRDESVRFTIRHVGGHAFWEALLSSGPGSAMAQRVPQPMLDNADAMITKRWPGPFEHQPMARHIVIHRAERKTLG